MRTVVALALVLSSAGPGGAAADHLRPGQSGAAGPPPGKAVFDRVCRVCHGPEGRGDAAPRLTPFARDIDEVLAIVRDGRGDMPPLSDRDISAEEVGQVVEYLKSLTETAKEAR